MTRRRFAGCLAAAGPILGSPLAESDAGIAQRGEAEAPRFAHASLAAYPGAVISLRDPGTGMVFYVESDGRRLVALDREGSLAWGLDVLAEAGIPPRAGKPVVRALKLDGARLWATCGKKDAVVIDAKTGQARYAGAD